jgi:hypothetical protein
MFFCFEERGLANLFAPWRGRPELKSTFPHNGGTVMSIRLSLYLLLYKMASIIAGTACTYMGYQLFLAGILSPATLEATRGNATLILQNAAPGTFFALFGTIIIGFAVFRGLRFESISDYNRENTKKAATSAKLMLNNIFDSLNRLEMSGNRRNDELLRAIRLYLLEISSTLNQTLGDETAATSSVSDPLGRDPVEVLLSETIEEQSGKASQKERFKGLGSHGG